MKNYDYVEWFCDFCGARMDFQDGFTTDSGVWKCKNCGCSNDVTEDNIIDESDIQYDDGDNVSDNDEEEIPEGCAACGGAYPYCKDGCSLFDD